MSASIIRAMSASIIALMMEAARTSETSVDNYFTRQYIPEDKSELHTRRRENLKSHTAICCSAATFSRTTTSCVSGVTFIARQVNILFRFRLYIQHISMFIAN
jgi:hypothetical protein